MATTTGQTWSKYGVSTPTSGTMTSIASAAALALDGSARTYKVTGTTTITSITGIPIGDRVTLLFAGILTLTNGANLIMAAATNLTTAANDVVSFIYDGTHVIEAGRSINH